ncbi:MAG TPA: MFS transporter [Anaerolineales bacterium]|nr:MFS transporter [Anaerolineales bacterium]
MRFNLFRQSDIPEQYRSNFNHLYLDIAWFGILSGTAVNFLNVYATRLGASGFQIGLLSAVGAVVNLFLAIPAGHWVNKRNTNKAVFWSSVFFRLGYVFWIPLPWLLNEQGQVWALIVLTFLMAIPLTPLGVGFNALFAESVPEQYRARVAGTRNITFAIAYVLSSLLAGFLLKNIPFPQGYQVIFLIGTIGAALSSYHLYHVHPLQTESSTPLPTLTVDSTATGNPPREKSSALRLDIWQTPFRIVLLGLFFFHFAQYIVTPLYPIAFVRQLHLNDAQIGNGTAFYYLSAMLASTQLSKIVSRFGNKRVTAFGAFGMASYPIMLAFAQNVLHYYALSFLNGSIFALVNGAYANYMLERIPPNDRPPHLAWYTIMLNFAILGSSLLGPAVADATGLAAALILFGLMRALAGVVLLKWG